MCSIVCSKLLGLGQHIWVQSASTPALVHSPILTTTHYWSILALVHLLEAVSSRYTCTLLMYSYIILKIELSPTSMSGLKQVMPIINTVRQVCFHGIGPWLNDNVNIHVAWLIQNFSADPLLKNFPAQSAPSCPTTSSSSTQIFTYA